MPDLDRTLLESATGDVLATIPEGTPSRFGSRAARWKSTHNPLASFGGYEQSGDERQLSRFGLLFFEDLAATAAAPGPDIHRP